MADNIDDKFGSDNTSDSSDFASDSLDEKVVNTNKEMVYYIFAVEFAVEKDENNEFNRAHIIYIPKKEVMGKLILLEVIRDAIISFDNENPLPSNLYQLTKEEIRVYYFKRWEKLNRYKVVEGIPELEQKHEIGRYLGSSRYPSHFNNIQVGSYFEKLPEEFIDKPQFM